MREIKFRGLNKATNKFVYGFITKNKKGTFYIENEFGMYKVEEETIGQFTGLHDKDGKVIYEGDTLKAITFDNPSSTVKGAVFYDENLSRFSFKKNDVEITEKYPLYALSYSELIGNIHENE